MPCGVGEGTRARGGGSKGFGFGGVGGTGTAPKLALWTGYTKAGARRGRVGAWSGGLQGFGAGGVGRKVVGARAEQISQLASYF